MPLHGADQGQKQAHHQQHLGMETGSEEEAERTLLSSQPVLRPTVPPQPHRALSPVPSPEPHALAMVVFWFSCPAQEGTHILGYLGHGSWGA